MTKIKSNAPFNHMTPISANHSALLFFSFFLHLFIDFLYSFFLSRSPSLLFCTYFYSINFNFKLAIFKPLFWLRHSLNLVTSNVAFWETKSFKPNNTSECNVKVAFNFNCNQISKINWLNHYLDTTILLFSQQSVSWLKLDKLVGLK